MKGRVKKEAGSAPSGKKQKKADRTSADADGAKSALDGLPERLKHQHKFVTCGADVNVHVGASNAPGALPSYCRAPLHRQSCDLVLSKEQCLL